LTVCGILALAVHPAYGKGSQDADLSHVDQLISEKQYDQAILSLSDYIKAYPDNFAAAQRRLQRIMRIRDAFNTLANKFLDVITSNPEDVDQILELTRRLEELESFGNPQFQAFIARTRELAQFTVNRNRLMKIMEEGRALIAAADYQGALDVYAGGLDIYRDEFFASGYGEIIENRVRQGIEDLNGGIRVFSTVERSLEAAASDFAQAVQRETASSAAGFTRMENQYTQLLPAADRLIEIRRAFNATAAYFDEQLARFQQADKTIGDRSFLSFASRLIRGSPGLEDGMIGTVEACWHHAVAPAEEALDRRAGQSYAAALAGARAQNYGPARTEAEQVGQYIRLVLALPDKWAGQTIFGAPVPDRRAGDFLARQSLGRAAGHTIRGIDLAAAAAAAMTEEAAVFESWRQGALTIETAMGRETQIRERIAGALAGTRELDENIGGEIAAAGEYQRGLGGTEKSAAARLEEARALIGELAARINAYTEESAVRFYTIANGDLENRLNSRRAEYAEGNRLIQGLPRSGQGAAEDAVDHYPAEGLAVLTRMEQAVAADLRAGGSLISRYQGENRELLGSETMGGLYAAARELVNGLENLRGQGGRLAATARTLAAQAESYRIDGERLYQEARNALGRNNFDTARERIQRATERFNASLAIQESASLRAEWWDTRLVNLGNEITQVENEIIIREVRNMVNNARTAYFAGNLEQAEELLVRANNRWKTTNAGEDSEVQYWLNVVRGALTLRSGRTISPTAPLYAEMSQLLSDAKKNYDEGARFFNAGQKDAGLAKFAEARQKIQEVKLMFPVNQDAGILELRIEQIIDPPAFNALFDRRFAAAVAGTSPAVKSAESFAELQNLAEINPRYPGMAATLIQAEINMGYRPPPPDPQAIARSNELTAQARQILEANVRSQFEIGLQQINEAILLNPNNTQATVVKDQIQTRMNGTGTFILSSRAEAEYQRALAEFQQGNYLISKAIVDQLLQDPKNRASTKIMELQRRIDPLL
jgi:hypothetical protein